MNIFGSGVMYAGHSLQKELFQVTAFFCAVQIITYRYRAALMRKYINNWFLLYVLNSIVGLLSLIVIVLISYFQYISIFLVPPLSQLSRNLLLTALGLESVSMFLI
jgi:hypothetical protein